MVHVVVKGLGFRCSVSGFGVFLRPQNMCKG